MVNKRIYTYLFSLLLTVANGQPKNLYKGLISWYLESENAIETISVTSGEHIKYFSNHVDTLTNYKLLWDSRGVKLNIRGHLYTIDDRLLAVFPGTGKVFEIDSAAQSIKRIDNTYHHGYNFGSYSFTRRDTIYSWSGYGFWATSNVLTYFSEPRKEWNLYSRNDDVFPREEKQRENIIAFYDIKNDKLFVWGHEKVFEFNFKNHLWTELGMITTELHGMNHRLTDSTSMIFNADGALEIYPEGNLVQDVTLPNKANTNTTSIMRQWWNCAYDLQNELLIPKFSDKTNIGLVFEYVPRYIRSLGDPMQLYEEKSWLRPASLYATLMLMAISLSLFIFALRRRYRSRRSKLFELEQWRLIDELMEHDLNTDELNVILQIEDKSWETQRRKRSDAIKEINNLGMKQFEQEIVLRIRNSEDKRQVLYRMNPLVKAELARLM